MRAIICGAGIAGLALAHRMATLGQDVTVLERTPSPRTQVYMIDFFGPRCYVMRAMGLLPALEEVAYHIREAVLVDEHGRRRAGIDIRQFAEGELLSVMSPDLERVSREHLPADIDLRYGATLTSATNRPDGVRIGLADGRRRTRIC